MDLQTIILNGVITVIVAIVGSGIFSLIAQKRITAAKVKTEEETAKKVEAETADLIQKSSGELVMAYREQMKSLREDFDKTKKELTERITNLESELKDAYAQIEHQNVVIKGLNKRILELTK